MTSKEIREKFLNFFKAKDHKIIPSAPLIPENDSTILFTTAGMHPLAPYLLGQKHALGKRLVDAQKCLRTNDIDEVGDDTHLTFFEMLGNWSLGDYFKKQTIEWSFEFLTKELNLPIEKLAVSVFEGEKENDIPKDEESAKIWQDLGIPKERIVYLGREDNWWGPAGQTGPCGPDTEIFYWSSSDPATVSFDPEDEKWVEIWNDVFMEYNKTGEGKFELLAKQNVDTGMGLERMAAVLQNKANVFETDLFAPIMEAISEKLPQNHKSKIWLRGRQLKVRSLERSRRIIADHLRASVFVLVEKLEPSNTDRGYVLRRLIRRAVRYGKLLGIEEHFTADIAKKIIEMYKEPYPELEQNKDFILEQLQKEEEKFSRTLERGLREFDKLSQDNKITGKEAFNLYQTYGFPIEMIDEIAKERGINFDINDTASEIAKHQEMSRAGAEKKFKSGLADHSEKTIQYHTATHLLHNVLREALGEEVQQKGSNITSERLRFDFSWPKKLTPEQLKKVEDLVNAKISEDLQIKKQEMSYDEAVKQGALAFFKEKYPDRVTVYSIGDYTKEICSGPHVEKTSELGKFKIIKEESVGAGIRRIKAILE